MGGVDQRGLLMAILPLLIPLTWVRSFSGLAAISVREQQEVTAPELFSSRPDLRLVAFPLLPCFYHLKAFGNVVFMAAGSIVLLDGLRRFGLPTFEDFDEEAGGNRKLLTIDVTFVEVHSSGVFSKIYLFDLASVHSAVVAIVGGVVLAFHLVVHLHVYGDSHFLVVHISSSCYIWQNCPCLQSDALREVFD